jgi:hypothetical protein
MSAILLITITIIDREDHFDSSHPGLALRVSETGRKTWTYFYRLKNGKVQQRRMVLGIYPAISVAKAHEAWRKALDLVQAGRDPAVAESKLPPMSFGGVVDEWLKRDQAGNRSYKNTAGRFRKYVVPAWKGRLITDIDRRACLDLIDTIRQGYPSAPRIRASVSLVCMVHRARHHRHESATERREAGGRDTTRP